MLPPDFQSLSAKEKLDILWSNTTAHPYPPDQLPTETPKDLHDIMDLNFLAQTLLHEGDEYPPGRKRLISPYGAIAKVHFRIFPNPTSPYTGIFQTGAHGLARLSDQQLEIVGSFNPSMAIKIPIDGQPSVNLQVLFDQSHGQGEDLNFFKNPFSNILPVSTGPAAPPPHVKAFKESLTILPGGAQSLENPESIVNLGAYEHAALHQDGRTVDSHVIAPYELIFKPDPAVAWDPTDQHDFRVNLTKIPEGSVLYTVFARRAKSAKEEAIGELVTESGFVASDYGDNGLFFKHARKRWQP